MKKNSENYNKEAELNLVDLIVYYTKKWKCALVLVVVMAIIGGIAGQYMKVQNAADTEDEIRNYSLSSAVKSDMDNAYNYQKLYDTQLKYTKNSIYMNLDYSHVYTGSLKYVLHSSENASTAGFGWQFSNIMNDSEILQSLKDITECTEDTYIREIAGASVSYPSATASNGNPVVSYNDATVTFWFYAPDEAMCRSMIDVVKEKAEVLAATLSEKNKDCTFKKAEESVTSQINTMIRDQQAANTNLLSNYSTSLNKLTEEFTEKQQAYYDVVYLGKEISSGNTKRISIKYIFSGIFAGAFLGILLWICYGFLSYLSDKHVKYANEMKYYFGLSVIGRYYPPELITNKIENWYESIKSKSAGPSNNENYLAAVLRLQGKELCLIGNVEDTTVQKLKEQLVSKNNCVDCGDLMQRDIDALEKAKKADGVVFLVHRGVSTYLEIRRELEICNIQEIPVLGTIVVE